MTLLIQTLQKLKGRLPGRPEQRRKENNGVKKEGRRWTSAAGGFQSCFNSFTTATSSQATDGCSPSEPRQVSWLRPRESDAVLLFIGFLLHSLLVGSVKEHKE